MAVRTIIAALLLIVIGILGYVNQDSDKASPTALIPAFFGGALALCGLLALKDNLRKHAMHAAAALALIGFLALPMPVYTRLAKGSPITFDQLAVVSSVLSSGICLVLLVLCVNSFIQARKARQAAASPSA
jgi:uncharacterized membrane protein (UPF0136 family)